MMQKTEYINKRYKICEKYELWQLARN
jgi:hypothetical protein